MQKLAAAALAALVLCTAAPAGAVEIAGTKIADDTTLAAHKLVLNGAGIRYRFGFQVYVCALYLPTKASTPKDVIAEKGPKRVSVTMLREISSDDLGDALLSAIKKNSTPQETQRFGLQLVSLGQLFATIPRLKKGESFTLDYVPDVGTVVSVNGTRAMDPLPDEAFYDALLRIWIGENPADSGLKPRLLGITPDENQHGNFR